MNEMQSGGLITMLSALPGLGLGLAMVMGRWKPASMASARDPDRARIATGSYCIVVGTMVLLLGTGLMLLPEKMGPYAAGAIVAVALLGLIPLLRATRT
jgi:hypothetical protein